MWPVIALKVHTVVGDGVKTVLPLKGSRCSSLLYITWMWPGAEMELVSRWTLVDRSGEVFNRRYIRQLNGEWIWQRQTLGGKKATTALVSMVSCWLSWVCFDTKSGHLWRGFYPPLVSRCTARCTTILSLLNVKVITSCHLFTQRHLLLLPQKDFRNLGF